MSTDRELRKRLKPCPECDGDGFTSEHNPNDPHENGCSSCPIQAQCERCRGEGYFVSLKKVESLLTEATHEARIDELEISREFWHGSSSMTEYTKRMEERYDHLKRTKNKEEGA